MKPTNESISVKKSVLRAMLRIVIAVRAIFAANLARALCSGTVWAPAIVSARRMVVVCVLATRS